MRLVLFAMILIVVSLVGASDAQWAIFQASTTAVAPPTGFGGGPYLREYNVFGVDNSVTPANYYVPGTGAPAISTADYYHENGLYGLRPYDLTKSACGAVGARIAQTNGRYAWVIEQDHNSINTNWANGNDHYIGFSNDPGILPDPSAMIPIDRFNSILSPAPGATFTGTIANPPGTQLNITAMTDGAITLGDTISGTGVTTGTVITAGVSGIGQTGTYTLDRSSTGATGSVAMTATQFNVGADYFPYLVCNPDDTTNPFYIYNQVHYNSGQYDTGPILSSDLSQQSSYVLYGDAFRSFRPNNSLARAMQIQRTGVGAWKAIGLTGVPDFSNNEANGLWTSSDGRYFSFSGTFLNSCLPPATGGSFDIFCDFANVGGSNFAINTLPDGFVTPVGGQNYLITAEASGWNATTNTTGLYATLVPVDANYSIISSPSPIRISDVIGPEGGVSFPGPRSVAASNAYQEDGILYDYVVRGFFVCLNAAGCQLSNVKYQEGAQFVGSVTGASGTSATLNVTSVLFGTIKIGQYLSNYSGASVGYVITSGSGSTWTITCSPSCANQGSATIYGLGGGLSQQMIDRYCYVYDASAAINAAPSGVKADTNAGVVTISWDQCVSGTNYRLYYGFSPTSQPNLIGSVTGSARTTTYTPNLQTPATMYFKLVTMNGSTEEGSRVVSTYVSSSSVLVNQHIKRVLAAGADPATVDRTWLDTVNTWLGAQGLSNNLRTWADPSFGVTQDGALPFGNARTVFDLGTTRLPRGGDLTFCTGSYPTDCSAGASTATYEPTAFGGTTPGVRNPSSAGYSFFGGNTAGGRVNNIRRMAQITVCSLYQKPGTATATLAAFGGTHFNLQFTLQHTSGTPGNASFLMTDEAGTPVTVTRPIAGNATDVHMICGTVDTTGATVANDPATVKVYADGVVTASPNTTGIHSNIDISLQTTLNGIWIDQASQPFLGAGSTDNVAPVQTAGPGPVVNYVRQFIDPQGNYLFGATMIFDKALNQTQITALYDLYDHRINPPVAITAVTAGGISAGNPASYNITAMPSGASATCNTGSPSDDSAAFSNFAALASAWDIANPNVKGSIVLNIPNSTCWFLQAGQGAYIAGGPGHPIVNSSGYPGQARVRIVGAGASSKLSDGGTGGGFFAGGFGQFNDNAHHALTATVSKGSTSVALTACPGAGCAAAVALFAVGAPARMEGLDLQGGGYPTNPGFWDFLTIACTSTTLTCAGGNVSFTSPLTHDYKSTWPEYRGGGFLQSGPAILYAIDPSFAVTIEYNKLIIDQVGQTDAKAQSVVWKNDVFLGSACIIASQNPFFAVINSTMTSCGMEVDKIVDTMVAQNVTINGFFMQSSSIKQVYFSEINVTSTINGSGINTAIANSTLASLGVGAYAYGASYGTTTLLNNSIASIVGYGAASSSPGVNGVGSWSGGVYTIADSDIPTIQGGNTALSWAVPGANVLFMGSAGEGQVIQILDVSHSGSNTLVTTSLAGGLPTMPGSVINARAHYAPQLFASGNTGSVDAIDLSQTPAGAPMWSYSKRVYTSNPGATAPVWGLFSQVNMTPTALYTGTALSFDLNTALVDRTSSSGPANFLPSIDVKSGLNATRTINPTSTSGSQGADSLSAPSAGVNSAFVSGQTVPCYWNGSACAIPGGGLGSTSVTLEIITNQQVVNPAQQ